MPAHRKPHGTLEASGAFKANPQRKRPPEPTVTSPLGNAPDYFSSAQVSIWREVAAAAPEGILTSADRVILELISVLLAEFRANPVKFNASKLGRLENMLGKVGCSPADRTRCSIESKESQEVNPFAAFGTPTRPPKQ